ncbi:hypothetical protein [Comamonas thiooxydans]|uniref:hypothetical protein n=1 Tax=Comamonas thiooxydans TaxID=363952 RepID=UPI00211442AF|nr:hypothetical protein [Comamonas thiooxydans]UUE95346.1 hypothetical protein MJ608_06820 [Comamonas thiooxydans]
MKFLRFDSEVVARVAFSDFMQKGDWPVYIGLIAVDVVGTVYKPTGVMLEDDIPEMEALPGFHINLSDSVHELAQYEIEAPATPVRVFAGSSEKVAPRVPAEVARWQAKLVLMRTPGPNGANLWDELMALRAAMADSENAVLLDAALLEVLNWRRTSPTVEWAAQQLGLSSAQVDELFIAAAALEL